MWEILWRYSLKILAINLLRIFINNKYTYIRGGTKVKREFYNIGIYKSLYENYV